MISDLPTLPKFCNWSRSSYGFKCVGNEQLHLKHCPQPFFMLAFASLGWCSWAKDRAESPSGTSPPLIALTRPLIPVPIPISGIFDHWIIVGIGILNRRIVQRQCLALILNVEPKLITMAHYLSRPPASSMNNLPLGGGKCPPQTDDWLSSHNAGLAQNWTVFRAHPGGKPKCSAW